MGEGDLGSMVAPGGDAPMPVNLTDVERWVAQLPLFCRENLARGPVSEDHDHASPCCNICRMMHVLDSQGRRLAVADFLDWWHTDKDAETSERELVSYLRCVLIYTLAGWDGVHREPDVCLSCAVCGRYYPAEHTDVSHGSDCCHAELLTVEFEGEGAEQKIVWVGT